MEDDVARDACIVHECNLCCEGFADAGVLGSVLLSKLEVAVGLGLEDEGCP